MNIASVRSLVDILQWRAHYEADLIAYRFLVNGEIGKEIAISYQELDHRAAIIASYLQQSGAPGKRVMLLYPASIDYIAAFFGCLYAGDIAVPAYPPHRNRSLERLQSIVTDSQAAVILTNTASLAQLQQRFADDSILAGIRVVATDDLTGEKAALSPLAFREEQLAFLQYTSGSTGTPKGVMVSHRNLVHNSSYIYQAFGGRPSKVVSWLPPFHDMGLIFGLLQPIYCGTTGILMAPTAFLQRPIRWLKAISHYRATASAAPNFAYDFCVERVTTDQLAELDLSSWEIASNGAEPVRSQTLKNFSTMFAPCGFRPVACYPCYGLAEATLMASGGPATALPVAYAINARALQRHRVVEALPEEASSVTLVGCGKSWLDGKIEIVDPETLTRCDTNMVGEIWLSSKSNAQGYWNRDQESKETFQAYLAGTKEGPFLRTGDLGFIKNEELFITGRLKDVIIIDGRNYYPQDIESVVERSHPSLGTSCCAAFAVDIANQERLVIVAEVDRHYRPELSPMSRADHTLTEKQSLTGDPVILACRRSVAGHFDIPAHTVALLKPGGLLKTTSGKVQRRACKAAFLAGTLEEWGRA